VLGSHFVAAYDSQGYDGGSQTSLHMAFSVVLFNWFSLSIRTAKKTPLPKIRPLLYGYSLPRKYVYLAVA
jgi:cellulose synthase/poly-beta-1,6-N-acetylglucosamine synthase-like glycosyltransferase